MWPRPIGGFLTPTLQTTKTGGVSMHACNVLTLAVEHDVLRLEIPVDDALGMEVAQGQRDLSQVEAAETGQAEGRAKVERRQGQAPPETHQAVSSRKMPSRSRCVKSSPPVTQAQQQLCTQAQPSCCQFLLEKSGACRSHPTCLPELPWGLNSISKHLPSPTHSVPGPVLGEAGAELRRPSHCPQDAQSDGETDMRTVL